MVDKKKKKERSGRKCRSSTISRRLKRPRKTYADIGDEGRDDALINVKIPVNERLNDKIIKITPVVTGSVYAINGPRAAKESKG